MKAETLRRLLTDDDLAETDLRTVIDRLADRERVFEASPAERERAAALASAYLEAPEAWMQRLGPGSSAHADVNTSRALAVALREIFAPGCKEARERLRGPATVALRQERDGEEVWEQALRPLLGLFAGHARACGATRQAAALKTLAASCVLKGEAQGADEKSRDFARALGSAASALLDREGAAEPSPRTRAAHALLEALSEQNRSRLSFWDETDEDFVRLLGAAAAKNAFAGGRLAPPTSIKTDSTLMFRLPEAWHERFSHLAASEAADALEQLAAHPRASELERRMAEPLAETLRAHPAADDVSFSEALGIEPAEVRYGAFRPGHPLSRASVRGRVPSSILCYGKRGRLLRCRAVADPDGAIVGYLAFDPLSRELGGVPLFALYGLDGRRYGYAASDGHPPIARSGEPQSGFATAPDAIPV